VLAASASASPGMVGRGDWRHNGLVALMQRSRPGRAATHLRRGARLPSRAGAARAHESLGDLGPSEGAYTPGRYIPVAVPGYEDATFAYNVNELGDVTGWYGTPFSFAGGIGFVEIGGKYSSIVDPALPAGTTVVAENVTPWGEIMATYTTPDGISHVLIDVNGKFTTLDDPNADNTVSGGGTTASGASMTGEIVGEYLGLDGVYHGFVYANGRWTTVDCPAGHDYAASILGYVSDFGRHMIALCLYPDNSHDNYIYTPDRTFSSSPANFTGPLPTPPDNVGGLASYNFVNDLGLTGGVDQVANPKPTDSCGPTVLDGFVLEHGQYTLIAPKSGLCQVLPSGANDLGVLSLGELNADGSAAHSFLVLPRS
jgi:hypothetical protein